MSDEEKDEMVGEDKPEDIQTVEDIGGIEEVTTPLEDGKKTKPSRRKSTRKKSSGVSAKKSEVKPVDEAKAEPAVVTPPASMLMAGDRISVQSLWPARLIIRGTPSGEEYVWAKAGALETVNPVDVDFLMSKNKGKVPSDGRGCCGGDGTRIYFQLV